MSNGKVIIIHLIVGLIKKTLYKMSQYFPKPYEPFGGDINVKVDLSNYATKADIKNISHVDTSSFALKTNLANLKTEVDKLDINKLAPVPADLSKLSNVVKTDVVKKPDYNAKIFELGNKMPDISHLSTKTALITVENKIPNISGLVKETDYSAKITEIESKIPDISNLATKTALTTVENKMPHVTSLATKTTLTTLENKIPDVSNLVKNKDYNTRVAKIDTKVSSLDGKFAELIENTLDDVTTSIFLNILGNTMFDGEDASQAYLIFQPVHKYIKIIVNTVYISESKSKLSAESIKAFPTSDNSLTPLIDYYSYKIRVKFNGSISRQPKVSYTHGKTVNIYIVYELTGSSSHSDDPTLKNLLFGAVTLTGSAGIDKYGYSGYGIGFDRRSGFSFSGGGFSENVVIFGADMSSASHIDNKKKNILVLGKGPTQ